jgi:signal transduction histidine kinase
VTIATSAGTHLFAMSWWDGIAANPGQAALWGALMLGVTIGSGYLLRSITRHTRSLHQLVLLILLVSLAIGAAAALVLGRLMVLDAAQARSALSVLAVTAGLAAILALVAAAPLGRDARRLEEAVRAIELGDRTARAGIVRSDELGHVALALDELTYRLDTLERERQTYEDERRLMLSSVGHDLRTPLAALRAAIEALADGVAPDPERYLRSMTRDVEALSALVDDLFLLSRIESGRLELQREPVDLSELADEAVEALTPAASVRGIKLSFRSPGAVPVTGSSTALGRVLRNLLDNAIRHAPEGSSVEVVVARGDRPTVRVVDQGPGFSAEFEPHAFEVFARADASRTRSTGGAGLGLAIARGLVESHGGRIWIERVDGGSAASGGRVAFELPAA